MIIASISKEPRHLILLANNALDKSRLAIYMHIYVVTCAYKDSKPVLSYVILVAT